MTAAIDWDNPPAGGWTTDDLDALPDDGRRYELVDGVLLLSPSPTRIHQTIAWRLCAALESSPCPDEYDVTQAVEVRVTRRRSFIPDVLVTTAAAAARNPAKYQPFEVVLAVEIVSPTSTSLDRVLKPRLYAEAGIPYYWRIETEDKLTIACHELDPVNSVYESTGTFDGVLSVTGPWPIRLPLDRLRPRRLG